LYQAEEEKMKILIRDLSFGYGKKLLFDRLNLSLNLDLSQNPESRRGDSGQASPDLPIVILGPSGCGKTTFLKLLAGLLPAPQGAFSIEEEGTAAGFKPGVSFVFQEPRLLPWLRVIENLTLPLKNKFPHPEALERAGRFLKLVSLEGKEYSFPEKLSGGERQRAAIARAFAYPSQLLLMDEPFQSLDIPLRLELMEMTLTLLKEDPRLVVMVTHDPREALYLGSRIIVFGEKPRGVIYDEPVGLDRKDRDYGSQKLIEKEKELITLLAAQKEEGNGYTADDRQLI
jgi:NitT/TauT family transport system ATP-binding protein